MVPQVLALAIELSVRENVTDALVSPDDVAVDALLVDLGLADEARRSVAEISMGQQQRTALARALAGHPLLVLADEPTSFQDGGHAASVDHALRRGAERGAAVVIATHDVAVVAAADRVLDLSPD